MHQNIVDAHFRDEPFQFRVKLHRITPGDAIVVSTSLNFDNIANFKLRLVSRFIINRYFAIISFPFNPVDPDGTKARDGAFGDS